MEYLLIIFLLFGAATSNIKIHSTDNILNFKISQDRAFGGQEQDSTDNGSQSSENSQNNTEDSQMEEFSEDPGDIAEGEDEGEDEGEEDSEDEDSE